MDSGECPISFRESQGDEAVRAFCKAGYYIDRSSSSHRFLKHSEKGRMSLSIPVHSGKTLGIGLLTSKIKDAGLTIERFRELLKPFLFFRCQVSLWKIYDPLIALRPLIGERPASWRRSSLIICRRGPRLRGRDRNPLSPLSPPLSGA